MDRISAEQRSALMARIRSKDTKPELIVRRLLFALGFRFRLHRRDLPGTPDIVFGPRRKLIFVHGCFWHGHVGCPIASVPKSHTEYWNPKIQRNRKRDEHNLKALTDAGWTTLVLWECEVRDTQALESKLLEFLKPERGADPGSPNESTVT